MTISTLPLTDLRESFDNDAAILGSILDMFLVEVPQDCLLLQQNIKNGDYHAAGLQAHKVKSSYRTLGINDMASILQKIEDNAKNNENIDLIPELLSQFNDKYEEVNNQVAYTKEQL
ncbi:Hpt domain-containing protein [Nonlabens dokdonensis]|jgi:HPt (histidine-containing phosphotransfer) domain-containing protein|uniref:Hpt domain-containing protein n=1 Tax=Nonlabens dokdonensis TaxID=328515 RepID=UPI0026F0EAF1|nr:Hpt domain-containing protein [Nonlabens dokdonensis]